ncbi:autotransporter-associated beta strand repeat-containing protein [soil metagenome]
MTPSSPARRRHASRLYRFPRLPRFSIKPVCFAACLAAQSLAMALPQGATPTFGQTQVKQTAPGQLAITQTTGKAGIDWQSFSIGAGERVVIQQPNASSVLLNRVTGYDPSLILGQMQSNGRVFLTNPRGVIFGAGSQVDVGGLVATSLGISNEAVQSGRYQLLAGSSAPGSIVAGGSIRASGTVALVAPVVEQTGSIVAGRVGLAAASSVLVDVDGDGLIFFNARNDGLDARLSVLGNIQAQGGTADIRAVARSGFADTVLNLDGVVQARGLSARGGKVIIDGGPAGITRVSGQVSADGAPGGTGGDVQVLGHQVLVEKTAVLSANGATGGGSVLVGGDYQGKNADVRNAADVIVQQGARLSANATERGDGGKVVVWSDGTTLFDGAISARGGPLGGNGGLVETSGKQNLGISTGSVDAGAVSGKAGTWLLYPSDLTIDESVTPGEAYPGVNGLLGARTIKPSVLNAAGTAITLTATNNIVVAAGSPVALATAAAGLTLNASNQITLNAGLSTNNGAISLTSGAGGISLAAGQSINAGNSTIALNAGTGNATLSGSLATTNATGTAIAVTHAANLSIGNISTGAAGTTTLSYTGAGAQVAGSSISAGSLVKQGGTGVLTLTGANTYAGTTTVTTGTLIVSGATAAAGTGAMTLAAGTALQIGNGATLVNSAITTGAGVTISANNGIGTIAGGITLNGATSFDATALTDQLNLNGPIGGLAANTFTKTGAGTVVLASANTYAGNTSVNAGTLRVSGAGANAGAGALALAAGTTLDIAGGANVGNSTLASADATISSVAGNGTLSAAAITLTGANTFSSGDPTTGLVVSGVVGGAVGLTKAGTGLVTFQGANTYTGTTTIAAGTLRADGATAKLGANASNVTLASGATLDITGGANVTNVGIASAGGTISSSTGAGTLTAPTVMTGTTTLSAGDIAAGLNVVGVISGAVGNGITKAGAGRVTLSQATPNTYGGDTTVNAGLLRLGADNVLPDAGALTVSGATTVFDLNGHIDTVGAVRLISGSINDVAGGGSLLGASYAVESGSIGANLGNASADLTKTTTGTVTMTGANAYRNTAIDNGTLQLSGATATAGTGTIALTTGTAVLDVSNGASVANAITSAGGTVGNSVGLGTLTAANGMTLSADSVLSSTLAGGGNGLTVAKSISGGFGVTKTGAGTVTLSGTNSYNGTTVSDGRLSLGAANSLPNSALTVSGTGAILDLNGQSASTGSVTLVAGSIVNSGAAAALTGTSYDVRSGTISAALAGASADLTKSTSGTVVLSGAGSYRNTIVNAGTLQLGADNVLPDAGALTVSGTTTVFDLNGHIDTVGAVRLISGSINDVAGGGSLLGASYAVESGSIGANLGNAAADLTKTTTGTVTMTGANAYRDTVIDDGTLRLGADNVLSAGSLTVNGANAVFDLNGHTDAVGAVSLVNGSIADTAGAPGALTGTGFAVQAGTVGAVLTGGAGVALSKTTSGTVTLSAANSYLGNTSIAANGGTLRVVDAGKLGADAGAVALGSGATLDIVGGANVSNTAFTSNGGTISTSTGSGTLSSTAITLAATTQLNAATSGDTLTVSGTMGGAAGANLSKTGLGTVVVSRANTYAGSTDIAAGTLQAAGTLAKLGSGAITLASNATLDIAGGAILSNPTLASAGGTIASSSGGGTLQSAITLGAASTTTLSVADTITGLTLSGAISGASTGALSKQGGGLATLSSASNNYGGVTTIANGTLATSAAERLPDAGAVVVDPSGILRLGGNETIGSLALSGTLNGTLPADTLSAATYALSGGTANANLGAGTLTSTGASALNGTAAATSVAVNTGTLTLGSANWLANAATVSVAAPATLKLNGNDTIANLALSGALTGTASTDTLTAATQATLVGGSVGTALVTPLLASTGNSTIGADVTASTSATVNSGTLTVGASGTLSAPSIFVLGGTLATSAADRIGNASALVVATGATLALGGSETITSLDLSGSLVASGTDRLTASNSASLNGGDVRGNLTTPLLTSTGASQIGADVRADTRATVTSGTTTITATGSLTAPTIRIDGGATLATATNELIGDASNLDIASGATLQLGGFETVSAVSLAGRITGPGSLNSSGGTTISDGSLDSPLITTTLTSLGTSSIGAAISATSSATVQSGTLTINAGSLSSPRIDVLAGSLITTASGQIGTSSAVNVASGASLQLAGAESIGAFTLLGSLNGSGSLLATTASLDGGTVNTALAVTTLTSTGASTLHAATSATGTATVTGGTLTVAADGTLAAPIVAVRGGTLVTAADERIADTSALQVGNGGTLALGGSETVASLADVTGQVADGTAAVQLGTHVLTVRNLSATTDTSFGGVISGTGADALVKDGLGTLRLAGVNTYTGITLVNAGTLATSGSANEHLADASAVQIANGATFALGSSETVASIGDKAGQAADGSAQIQLGTHLLTVANTDATTDTTFSGVISGTGNDALTKSGAGTLRLAGANTYTGTTLVAAGTLATIGSERLADASAMQVATGAALQLGGNETVASIGDPTGQTGSSTASIALGANTLTVKSLAATTDTTFSGAISGTGANGLTKDGAGTLRLAGANTYSGITLVEAGTLATVGDERLADTSNVQVANGARLAVGGTETVASIADKTGQTPNGSAVIDVATSLTAGGVADTTYSGTITGSGGLAKSGAGTLILTGNNSYAGTTTIAAGTLQIGSGGTTGELGQGAVIDNATLRFVRSDAASVANAIGGSGSLEQAGSSTLTLSSPLNSYAGATTITSGTLATAAANQLPDASAVIVKPAAALVLGGEETVGSIQSEGTVTLNGSVTTAGDQSYVGAVIVNTSQAIMLKAHNLDAVNDGNKWGGQPLSLDIDNRLTLSSGKEGSAYRDLTLGTVSVGLRAESPATASQLDAGLLALSGNFGLLGGTFTLTANAAPASYALVVEEGKVLGSILGPDGRTPVAEASDVITQTGGAITTAAGSSLAFLSPNKGSMTFANESNNFLGAFSAVSGAANTPWTPLAATVAGAPANVPGGAVNGLSRITVAGNSINVGPSAKGPNSGLEADLVRISANQLATHLATGADGTIVARLPYNDGLGGGTNASTPGLRITLLKDAFGLTEPFGNSTIGISTRIGDLTDGPIPGIFSAGFMQVLPLAGRQGATSVFLTGPAVSLSASGYRFFNDGAGVLTEIPVYYNGFSPDTPQKSGALSAAASVSEEARRQRFEEAVRTENVAVRLRSGVIAEVGPGRPATVGSDGVKPPVTCSPKEGELRCADAPPKTKVSSMLGALRKVVAR